MTTKLKLLHFKKRTIKLLFLIGLLVTVGCQEDDVPVIKEALEKDSGVSTDYVSGNEIPKIIDFIQPEVDLSSKTSIVSTPFGAVAIESILKTVDPLGNDNYSFIIQPKTPKPNSVFNLLITTSDQHKTPNVAIIEYRMTPEFAEAYRNDIKPFSEFEGNIYTFPFSAASGILEKDVCIQNIDEVVNCDLVVIGGGNTGTTGGGGGTTTIGDTTIYFGNGDTPTGGSSSGGAVAATLSWVCNAYHENHAGPIDCCCSSQGGSWVLRIISNTKSSTTTISKQGTNCCDDTTPPGPGPVGVNLLAPMIDYIRNCVPLNIGSFAFLANSPNTFPLRSFIQNKGCTNETKSITKAILDFGAANRATAEKRASADKIIADLLNDLNSGEISVHQASEAIEEVTKAMKVVNGDAQVSSLNTIAANQFFMRLLGANLSSKGGDFIQYGAAWADIDPDGHLELSDWISISGKALLIKSLSGGYPVSRNIIAQNTAEIALMAPLKSLFGEYWPQTSAEWAAIGEIVSPLLLDVGLALIPGSDIIGVVQGVANNDYVAATIAIASLTVDLFGGTIIKVVAKFGRAVYKAFKIARVVGDFLVEVGTVLRKGFAVIYENGQVLLKKNGNAIAQGDDVGRVAANVADAVNDTQKNVINQHRNSIASATNKRKGNFGEMASDLDLGEKGYIPLHNRIDNIDAAGHNGIDAVMEKNEQYFIVESKFSSTTTPSLNPANPSTGLPKQMSDNWIRQNQNERLINALGGDIGLADQIASQGYTRIVATHGPNGNKIYKLVNSLGNIGNVWTP